MGTSALPDINARAQGPLGTRARAFISGRTLVPIVCRLETMPLDLCVLKTSRTLTVLDNAGIVYMAMCTESLWA